MRRLGAVIVAAVLVLLAVEGLVRLLGLAPPLPQSLPRYASSPALAWGPVPLSHYAGTAATGEYTNDLSHNSLGFRDVEHAIAKPPGTFRILGLGDSFTYGSGAEYEETWLRRLELALGARPALAGRLEVIKAGVSRFFPEPERVLLGKLGVDFHPDLVLVGFTANDVYDTCLGPDAIAVAADGSLMTSPAAELGPAGAALYERSHAARIVLRAWVSRNFMRRCPYGPGLYRDDGPLEPSWRAVEAELSRMEEIARNAGARLVVVNIPDPPPWSDLHRYPGARLGAWAARSGAGFVDALPAMEAAAARGERLYYAKDPHCTPEGYAVLADAVARYLVDAGLVP